MLDREPAGFRLKGWHVAAIVVGFFTVVIAVDTGFIVAALRTYPGEVSTSPYEDGIAYNHSLASRAEQRRLGWRAEVVQRPGEVALVMRDGQGRALDGLVVQADLQRPATELGRRRLSAEPRGGGLYAVRMAGLAGAWDVGFAAHDRMGHAFAADTRVVLP